MQGETEAIAEGVDAFAIMSKICGQMGCILLVRARTHTHTESP